MHGCLYQIQRRKQCFSSELLKTIAIKSNVPEMMCRTSFGLLFILVIHKGKMDYFYVHVCMCTSVHGTGTHLYGCLFRLERGVRFLTCSLHTSFLGQFSHWLEVDLRDPSVSCIPPYLALIWVLDLELWPMCLCGIAGRTEPFSQP